MLGSLLFISFGTKALLPRDAVVSAFAAIAGGCCSSCQSSMQVHELTGCIAGASSWLPALH